MPLELNLGNLQYKNENGNWVGIPAFGAMDGSSGGESGSEAPFELIDIVDWSTPEMAQMNSKKIYSVDGVKEIIFIYNDMKNGAETASTVNVVFDDNSRAIVPCAKTGKSSQALHGYVHFKLYENVGMRQYISSGAVMSTNFSVDTSGGYSYNLLPVTQPVSKIEVQNTSTQYYATEGTTKIFVR